MPAPPVPASEQLRHSLGLKVTDQQLVDLTPFFETFPGRSRSEGLRWVLTHPAVWELIDERIRGSLVES